VALIILLFSGVSKSHAVHDLFKSIDENEDGKINQEEFLEDMEAYVFDEFDNNNNKAISKAEWMSIEGMMDPEKHEELFQRIDKDKDENNSLSPDEITNRPLFEMITIKFK